MPQHVVNQETEDIQLPIFKRKVILTNAQIKALPSTPITLVPAPGVGKRLLVWKVEGNFKVSVPYTNLGYDDGTGLGVLAFQTQGFGVMRFGIAWYGLTGNQQQFSLPPIETRYSGSETEVSKSLANAGDIMNQYYYAENIPLTFFVDNFDDDYEVDLGDFTGGDASNTMEVTVFYSIVDL